MLTSAFCTYAQYNSPDFKALYPQLGIEQERPHRKHWELAFIAQAVKERKFLRPGNKGLGFGVGIEPLPCFFANAGCNIVATDGPLNPLWSETNQHCMGDKTKLDGWDEIEEEAQKRIRYQEFNMTADPFLLHGQFDFVWSTSSLEHLGSLEAGEKFIHDSLDCLVPGGIAVHVTECSVYPGIDRDHPTVALYSASRIERLCDALRAKGRHVHVNWSLGNAPEDYYVDQPPYDGPLHLKVALDIDGCATGVKSMVVASLGLIIQ